jgi:hypothetical protein
MKDNLMWCLRMLSKRVKDLATEDAPGKLKNVEVDSEDARSLLLVRHRSPTSRASSPSPILALPAGVIGNILCHLSAGRLSSHQRRLVLTKCAANRSTLGGKGKTATKVAFLRATDCRRWQSELDRVNFGLCYK